MPTLDWIGKAAAVNHHRKVPYHGKGPRVVYGEACRLGPKSLEQYGITFRQVPFELKVD